MSIDFPTFLVIATAVTGIIWLIDAIFFARFRKASKHKPIIVEYSKSFFPVFFIVLVLRSFVVEPFRIPSGSMMPTLLIGDFILVNKYAYGLRLPVLNTKVVDVGTPHRGDVLVFRYPQNPNLDYIKRVIGVPGDVVSYKNKTLYVNGLVAQQTKGGIYTGVGSGAGESGSFQSTEQLDTVKHPILIRPLTPDFTPDCHFLPNTPIPPGHYFVMGDNRDNSNDGRCWGLVPEANLVGRAFVIWMNWDLNRDSLVDWNRIGLTIH